MAEYQYFGEINSSNLYLAKWGAVPDTTPSEIRASCMDSIKPVASSRPDSRLNRRKSWRCSSSFVRVKTEVGVGLLAPKNF